MTDYDSIRTCCSDAAICNRCWKFIAIAVKVLDRAIREQYGYQHLLWVYSGRRGIHLWVSDKEAMELTDDQRRALVNWMTVIQGGKEMHKKVNVRMGTKPLPPSIAYVFSRVYHTPELMGRAVLPINCWSQCSTTSSSQTRIALRRRKVGKLCYT